MKIYISHIKDALRGIYPESEISSFIKIIVSHIARRPFTPLLLEDLHLTDEQKTAVEEIVERLKKKEPIQYITGECEFFSLPFSVSSDVLIPRPETEELVELIIQNSEKNRALNILDIGTGSGAIAVALAANLPKAQVEAWDVSPRALGMAHENAERNGVDISFSLLDIFEEIPLDQKYDIIVSNPPYVLESEKEEMDKNVLDYEPHLALFVPNDKALIFYNRIAEIAKEILKPNATLYFEINRAKGDETKEMLIAKGFTDVEVYKDLSQNDRMIKATWAK